MKKILNFRPLLFAVFFFILGIAVGSLVYRQLFIVLILPIAPLAIGILLSLFTKKHICWVLALAFACGVFAFYLDEKSDYRLPSGSYTVTGRVTSCSESGTTLDNIALNGVSEDGYVFLPDQTWEVGTVLRVRNATVTAHDFSLTDSYERFLYCRKEYYTAVGDVVAVETGKTTLSERIRSDSSEIFLSYMPQREAGVAMSLIFGDKSVLLSSADYAIKNAGLAHIFAVSGLHIGFVAAILLWILKKLRCPLLPSWLICLVGLFAYGLLTGFPSGAKRATVTFLTFFLSKILFRKNDTPTSLALAMLLILLLNPRELFDVSFLMSFGAVGGIHFFYSPLYSFLGRFKTKPWIAKPYSLLCVTLSANVFTLPLLMGTFGEFSTYSFLGNLILPLVTVAFSYGAIVIVLALIFRGFGILLTPLKYLLIFIDLFCASVSSLPSASLSVAGMGFGAIFYYLFFLTISRFVRLNQKVRIPLASLFAAATLVCMLV